MEEETEKKKAPHEKPISLYPLTPEEALKKLLGIPPQKKEKKRTSKK